MRAPLRRVRYSIDVLQKNIYEYHHTNSFRVKSNNRFGKFIKVIEDSCAVIQALFVRLIFVLSTLIAVWRLVEVTKQKFYWYLLLLLIFLLIETYITVYTRKGYEYKWFCPSAFTYLIAIVPCIWLLELHESHQIISLGNQTKISSSFHQRRFDIRTTTTTIITILDESNSNETQNNEPIRTKRALPMIIKPNISLETILKSSQEFVINLNRNLTSDEWNMLIEQKTLLVFILSRWLLPNGALTREELSQLLLVYIGFAADIIEFFEVFKVQKVRTTINLCVLSLTLWTLSLLQFCLAFTISRGRHSRVIVKSISTRKSFCNPSDFWGMFMSLFLQDIPFFSFRLVLILRYQIISYSTLFFTAKNGLIIILQCYRMTIILAATISQRRPKSSIRILQMKKRRNRC